MATHMQDLASSQVLTHSLLVLCGVQQRHARGWCLTVPCSLQVMDLLGPSLWDAWNTQSIDMTPQYVACVAVEAIIILQALHEKG